MRENGEESKGVVSKGGFGGRNLKPSIKSYDIWNEH